MTRHMGNAGRRVSLRSTMTRQPRIDPRPEPTLATSAARAGWDRLVALIHRYPLLTDAALAAAVLVLSVPPFARIAGPDPGLWLALVGAMAVALVWRRRAPFGVFALIGLVALVQWFTPQAVSADPLLVAFYTVAAYEKARLVVIAAALLWLDLLPAAMGDGSWQSKIRTLALLSAYAAVAGFAGYYARTRRAYLAALEDRAGRLERERDQQAQLAAAAERSGSRARCTTSSRTISR
jgi:hypothetical protein